MSAFKFSKRTILLTAGLLAIVGGGMVWATSQYPYLLENPAWLFSKPTDENVIQELPSVRNVDYKLLRSHLQAKQWEAADKETERAIAKLMVPSHNGFLLVRASDIRQLPCTDLYTLDRLWSTYSNGRFGFKAQAQVVESDRLLPTPVELQQQCIERCQRSSPSRSNCMEGCFAERIRTQVDRIPASLGHGNKPWKPDQSAVSSFPPKGYYPFVGVQITSKWSNFHPYTYQEFGDRSRQCGL